MSRAVSCLTTQVSTWLSSSVRCSKRLVLVPRDPSIWADLMTARDLKVVPVPCPFVCHLRRCKALFARLGALHRPDIGPALMRMGEGRDFLPDCNIVYREEGILTMGGTADHLIDLAGPSSRGHRVGSDSLIFPDDIGQWDLGELPKASTEPFVDHFKGPSPVLVINFWGLNIYMTGFPILVGLHGPDCIKGDDGSLRAT